MRRYHFSLGDSNTGPIGLCADVVAGSRQEAVHRLRELVAGQLDDLDGISLVEEEDEYLRVYLNPDAITIADIDEIEPTRQRA